MTVSSEERLTILLDRTVKAEEEVRKELRKIVENAILTRIDKGERKWGEEIIDIANMLAPKIFPRSNLAGELAQTTVDAREQERASLTSAYYQMESSINQFNSSALYDILKRLKKKVSLRKIFEDIPPPKADHYEPVPISNKDDQA